MKFRIVIIVVVVLLLVALLTTLVVHFKVSNTSITTTTNTAATTATTVQNQQPIEVVSILVPQMVSHTGQIVEITLKNVSAEPVVSLTGAIPGLGPRDYEFDFAVDASNPLLSEKSISYKLTIVSGGFANISYPLTIKGTLQNGATFNYIKQVRLTP